MKKFTYSFPFLCMIFMLGANGLWGADFSEVEKILGTSAKMQEGAVVFPFPRNDIKVEIDGAPVPAALGFGSWTAWKVWTLKSGPTQSIRLAKTGKFGRKEFHQLLFFASREALC
jgi:hypothetical protein